MGTSFDNASLFQDHDTVGIPNRRQTVCDHKRSTSMHQSVHAFLNNTFSTRINRACSLIQDQYRRICNC